MSVITGFPSGKLEYRTEASTVSVEPVRSHQHAVATVSYGFLREILSTTINSVGSDFFDLAASGAAVGDFVLVTSGSIAGFQSKVIAVSGTAVKLADSFSPPSIGDSVEVLRHQMPRVNSLGELLTSGSGGGGSAAVLATKVDEISSTVTYVGKADPGTSGSAASWQIQRITVSGTITTIEFADGNSDFDNIWNNRASLTYS